MHLYGAGCKNWGIEWPGELQRPFFQGKIVQKMTKDLGYEDFRWYYYCIRNDKRQCVESTLTSHIAFVFIIII